MTDEIPTPADALHALTEAMKTLDASLRVHQSFHPRRLPHQLHPDDAQICFMHTGEIYNRIQKIRRRVEND